MTTTKQKMVEAIERLKILDLNPKVIKDFTSEGKLYISYRGILCDLTEKQKEKVKDFEVENDCLVYHTILNDTSFGEMLTFLYVSKYTEEWETDRNDLAEGKPIAYVVNLDAEFCSEFGTVCIKEFDGALLRTE